MSRDFCQCIYYIAEKIFYYCTQEGTYYSQHQHQPEVSYKIPLIAKVQYQCASESDNQVYQRSIGKIVI